MGKNQKLTEDAISDLSSARVFLSWALHKLDDITQESDDLDEAHRAVKTAHESVTGAIDLLNIDWGDYSMRKMDSYR